MVLYIDCINGVSGDMFLGGLLSAGLDEAYLRRQLATLDLSGWELLITDKSTNGIMCKDVTINHGEDHPHRNLDDILGLISGSGLTTCEKELAERIFTNLARAEAKVHGMSLNDIHFHEVGAVDAIIDICGAAIGVCGMGLDRITCSPLPVGSGFIDCMHGRIPVPAPATVELLKGIPVHDNGSVGELVTPTGAAIVSTISQGFGKMPDMGIDRVGYGCGKKRFDIPNVVRLLVGSCASDDGVNRKYLADFETDEVMVIETSIDDMTPELLAVACEEMRSAGAVDAWTTAIGMKKSRMGFQLTVLCEESGLDRILGILFESTTTLGVRVEKRGRVKLRRSFMSVDTQYGKVSIKVGMMGQRVVKAVPEYEDCVKCAKECSVPVALVYEQAKVSALKEAPMN